MIGFAQMEKGDEMGMNDRKKIIRFIEEEISVCESANQCYRKIDLPTLRDILALLKEQEYQKYVEPIPLDSTKWSFRYTNCFNLINWQDKFFQQRGRRVK